ncbi:death-associated inhibitor of apoptosis 2-like [Colletes gigas]|uniref:death-associated inhibitor of apoptosis 2-like n=1 Tax=Colletes gigas TaxID=935657 RepID=UPI001C9B206B|nr:death-associated inhibitor of apoptosis 2-like [Colletes gigas]
MNNISDDETPTRLRNEDFLEELASTPVEERQENERIKQLSIRYLENKDPSREYRNLTSRLLTFSQWPISSILSFERIAKSGFYYLQYDDMVQCAYCASIVWKWKLSNGLNPDTEYMVHFPDCDRPDRDDILYLNNIKLKPGKRSSLTKLGVQIHTAPKNPNYSTYEKRLHTFYGWPENRIQTPKLLSIAGFYYTGFGDLVRCFHCDVGIRSWEATDEAWNEHVRWSPKCVFVNLIRGPEFVKRCIDNRRPLSPSIFRGVAEDGEPATAEAPPSLALSTNLPSTQDNGPERLSDSPLTTYVSEIALHTQRINTVMTKLMETIGPLYLNFNQHMDVPREQIMEDDTRNESISTLDHAVREQINYTTEQSDDNESHTTTMSETTNEYKNEILSNKEEEHEISNNESDENKLKIKLKEIASLKEENKKLKEARLCKICIDRQIAIVFLPCGHLTCIHCALSLAICPMCRREIRATVRAFLS